MHFINLPFVVPLPNAVALPVNKKAYRKLNATAYRPVHGAIFVIVYVLMVETEHSV